jgi:hypothetical protein
MPTRRYTAAEVLAAYQASGLVPARTGEDWFDEAGCGCGLTALVKARRPEFCNPHWPTDLVAEELGITHGYMIGFARGFDGVPLKENPRPEELLGFEDGTAAALAVFSKFEGTHA